MAEPRQQKLDPRNSVDAQFSLPYSMAVALARRSASLRDFDAAAIADPAVRGFMPLVTAHHEAELDAMYPQSWPARVRVQLTGGSQAEILLTDCAGDPSRPLTWAQLQAKFLDLACGVLGADVAQRLMAEVSRFTELGDLGELMELVAAPSPLPAEVGGP